MSDDVELRAEDIAEEYLEHLQAGGKPDRAAWLSAHPEIADVLAVHLSVIERIHRAAKDGQPEANEAPIPRHIDRYEILDILGRGACGTVYRAHDPKFDRDVALKVLRSELASDPHYGSRFR